MTRPLQVSGPQSAFIPAASREPRAASRALNHGQPASSEFGLD
jgi:hypothetical protein